MGIASLILGILGLVNFWDGSGWVFGIVALILGSKALANNPMDGKAKAGKTMGLISTIIGAIGLVVIIIIAVAGGIASMSY